LRWAVVVRIDNLFQHRRVGRQGEGMEKGKGSREKGSREIYFP